jgi:hypothetical protein
VTNLAALVIRVALRAEVGDTGSMKKPIPLPLYPSAEPVSLAAAAVHSLIQLLPAGTAFCIGVVLRAMMTGRLGQHPGSLARAVLPFGVPLRWGWHRVARAMARGKRSLAALFAHAFPWCVAPLPVEPVRLGCAGRALGASDTSTMVRLRAGPGWPLPGRAAVTARGAPCGHPSSRRPPASS